MYYGHLCCLSCFVYNDGNPNLAMAAMLIKSIRECYFRLYFVVSLRMRIFGAVSATSVVPVWKIYISVFFDRFIGFLGTSRRLVVRPFGRIVDLCRRARRFTEML